MSGIVIAVVDSGPLYAAADKSDQDHARSVEMLQRPDLRLVIPAMVITEVTYMVGRRIGAAAEAAFLEGLTDFDIEAPAPEDWPRIADLVTEYADFPLGGTDASVVALAERLDTTVLMTLDHRHFGAVRPKHCPTFELLPA